MRVRGLSIVVAPYLACCLISIAIAKNDFFGAENQKLGILQRFAAQIGTPLLLILYHHLSICIERREIT